MSDPIVSLRKHLLVQLKGGEAYDTFDQILSEIPAEKRFDKPAGAEHSAWEIVDHMAFTLDDLVDYSTNSNGMYKEKNWPNDYWPADHHGPESWDRSIEAYKSELAHFEKLVETEDLFAPFPWAPDHTLFREVNLATDHAAYHLGELVMLTRLLKLD